MKTLPTIITLGAAVLLGAFLSQTPAHAADAVVLKDGRRIEGTMRTLGKDWVEIVRTYGSIKIHRQDIAKIVVDDESAIRQATLETSADNGGVREKLILAAHYQREGRGDLARATYKAILADDPDNEQARHELGYKKVSGIWMTEEEANLALGLVPYKGRWVKPDEREMLIKAELAAAEAARKDQEDKIAARRARREEKRERERARREYLSWRPQTAYAPRYDDYRRGGYGYGSYNGGGYYGHGRYSVRRHLYPFGYGYGGYLGRHCLPQNNNLFKGYGHRGFRHNGGVRISGAYTGKNFGVKFSVNP